MGAWGHGGTVLVSVYPPLSLPATTAPYEEMASEHSGCCSARLGRLTWREDVIESATLCCGGLFDIVFFFGIKDGKILWEVDLS